MNLCKERRPSSTPCETAAREPPAPEVPEKAARLPEPPPIEAAILNRLADLFRLQVGSPLEVGDGAGDLENPVIRPRGQGER